MGKVTLNDYDKIIGDKGEEIYSLSDEAVRKHNKKELAGIPKTITVHKSDNGEHIFQALAESACKVLEKLFDVD